MEILFYIFGIITILSTLCVILCCNPIYALLYLIISLLSISCDCFILGASFAGSVEVIVYAGAIMVLFVFVIMMLNTGTMIVEERKNGFLDIKLCILIALVTMILLIILLYVIFDKKNCFVDLMQSIITFKQIGTTLFGPYLLLVELASFLLLSALISVLHLSQEHELFIKYVSDQLKESKV